MRLRLLALLRSTLLPVLALAAAVGAAVPADAARPRDLLRDEKRGGHTLARHVGQTDAELRERLRREPGLAAASSYPDRATAEKVVSAAIATQRKRVDGWVLREGTRTNLVLEFKGDGKTVIGRSLRRGDKAPVPCKGAVVVLKWNNEAEIYYVLTSYPEASR